MLVGELAGAVLGTGFGEPGTDPDHVTVDADRLAGGRGAAFSVEEELQKLHGLFEGATGAAGGGERVALRDQAEESHQVLPAGLEGLPGGELAAQPGADLHTAQKGVTGERGRVSAGREMGAQ